jgi:hypothetical protein
MKVQYILALGVTLIVVGSGLIISSTTDFQSKSNQSNNNDSLESVIKRQDSLIIDLQEQVEVLNEECQLKESEISYWGQKYDSLHMK